MAVLTEGQRRSLEKAVQRARDIAEDGARASITQLAVHNAEPFSNLSPEKRDLRNRLRVHARQLGDTRDAKTGKHGIDHLVVEVAYEHWHRMLFARFLAENAVLMHPEDGVPVTLEECDELAPEKGAADGWELASRYAERMLPQIFRPGSPIFELKLAPEKLRELEGLLEDLQQETFTASDSLGWVYQFWQAKKKKEVNDSGERIGADQLPAVTQLFTEPYMVQFLLHNTLGAWWIAIHSRSSLPMDLPYLRYLKNDSPAVGQLDSWPKEAASIRVLDPCCGSGHFLVAAFEILAHFRMAEEDISPAEACDDVIRDNLHGLEIDERCTHIAAFALALAAWTFPGAGGFRPLPSIRVACSGLAPRIPKKQWVLLAGKDVRDQNAMERLYDLFSDAPTLGSLVDPSGLKGDLLVAGFSSIRSKLRSVLQLESSNADHVLQEVGITALGIADAAEMLCDNYHLVATNVPYLARKGQDQVLRRFCERHHEDAKIDLATAFLSRCQKFGGDGCVIAAVVPNIWLTYMQYYKGFRERLLKQVEWRLVAQLGKRAFQAISGEVVDATLFINVTAKPNNRSVVAHLSVASEATPADKARTLYDAKFDHLNQLDQFRNPGSILKTQADKQDRLQEYVHTYEGLSRGDTKRFTRRFWEIGTADEDTWKLLVESPEETGQCTGRSSVFMWEDGKGSLSRHPSAYVRGRDAWDQPGVIVSKTHLNATRSFGDAFANNCVCIVPNDRKHLDAIWAFCTSEEYSREIGKLNQKLIKPTGVMDQVPFSLDVWKKKASGLSEKRHSLDPTQWWFDGEVKTSTEPLQVAVALLLGYRWPNARGNDYDDLIDDDGIVCLPSVRAEPPAATQLQQILARAYGDDWTTHKQAALLEGVGCKGWTLDRWLNDKFFLQHCTMFEHRPFIWHIWDGLTKGGFSALVNYHKLNRNRLETLTYNYLGDWIGRQKDDEKRGVDGAGDRLVAAKALQDKLKLILKGEPPCDIFVRWKPIEEQPMGWEPDINDGVRINIRPFMMVGNVSKKGAGILRDKPNIKWTKDRGKDPSDAPWYELGPKSGGKKGDRINEHHLTLEEKQAGRNKAGGRS